MTTRHHTQLPTPPATRRLERAADKRVTTTHRVTLRALDHRHRDTDHIHTLDRLCRLLQRQYDDPAIDDEPGPTTLEVHDASALQVRAAVWYYGGNQAAGRAGILIDVKAHPHQPQDSLAAPLRRMLTHIHDTGLDHLLDRP